MTVSRVPSIPWSIYSHCTITATIHPPHTLHNLLTPSYLWKETKTLLHTSAEVSNSDCPLWSHTSPEQSIFILPPIRLFSASLSASPGLLHHLYHLHASMPQWKCADMAGWRWQRSDDWKLHCCRRQGDGFVATSLCTCAINKYTAFMSYKYSDSVSSCCGLQRAPNWSDELARGKKQWEWLIPKMFIINHILLACCRTYNMKSK